MVTEDAVARPPTRWRSIGEAVLAAELCLVAASPFAGLFEPGVLEWRLLVAALLALVPGVLLRWGNRRPAPLVSVAVAVVVFIVLATVACFADIALGGVVPGPDVISALLDGLRNGPRQMLTSAVPAPVVGELVLVPVALVFWAVVVASELTWRTSTRLLAPMTAVVVFGVGLAFEPPASGGHVLAAALLAALSLLYVMVRRRSSASAMRVEAAKGGSVADRGRMSALAMLGVAAVAGAALALATIVPISGERYALRDSVNAPIQPIAQIDPLLLVNPVVAGDVTDLPVMDVSTTDGSMERIRMPIARLDAYDCASGGFRSSGQALASANALPPLESDAETTGIEVTLLRADSRVLPIPGHPVNVEVADGAAIYADADERLVQLATTPMGTVAYRAETIITSDLDGSSSFAVGAPGEEGDAVRDCEAASDVELSSSLEAAGLPQQGGQDALQSLALWCEALKVDPEIEQGDDLSFARLFGPEDADPPSVSSSGRGSSAQVVTACAALGQRAGLPVRVAVGYVAPIDGGATSVRTVDLLAWLEVQDADGLWHPVPVLGDPDPTAQPPPEALSSSDDAGDRDVSAPPEDPNEFQPSQPEEGEGLSAPWAVLVGLVAVGLGLAAWFASKASRRRRRRQRGSAAARLEGAWLETVDTLGAAGIDAESYGPDDIAQVAIIHPASRKPLERLAGLLATSFSPDPPTDEIADDAWAQVELLRRTLRARGSKSATTGEAAPPPDDIDGELPSNRHPAQVG